MAYSYDVLDNEAAWRDEYETPAVARFNARLRAFYGLSRAECGSKGDNRHLKGRHRSKRWCLTSAYCTNRSYGTTDARDKAGDENALRANDTGIRGRALRDATARLLAAKRAGRLPQLAEFYGTVDGVNVVGWFEGHESSSDDSHLVHLHDGWWTNACHDDAFFDELFVTITGVDMNTLVILKGDPRVWLGNGVTRRHVKSPAELTAIKAAAAGGNLLLAAAGRTVTVASATELDAYGADIATLGAAPVPADLTARLDAILAAAQDDGDTTVVLDPAALAEVQAIRADLAGVPQATAELVHADLAD